jgi:hypothetical protein
MLAHAPFLIASSLIQSTSKPRSASSIDPNFRRDNSFPASRTSCASPGLNASRIGRAPSRSFCGNGGCTGPAATGADCWRTCRLSSGFQRQNHSGCSVNTCSPQQERDEMAKGQLRSNREKKKPKGRKEQEEERQAVSLRLQGLPKKATPAGSLRAHWIAAPAQHFPERQSRKLIVCSPLGARI